jgi:hypothetical protein
VQSSWPLSRAFSRPDIAHHGEGHANDAQLAGMLEDGYSDLSFEEYLMIRLNVIVVMLSVGIGPLAMEANAQSPNPALLAPGQSGRMLAPAHSGTPRPTYTSPRPGGTPQHMKSHRGHPLSHPRVHGH